MHCVRVGHPESLPGDENRPRVSVIEPWPRVENRRSLGDETEQVVNGTFEPDCGGG